VAYVSVERVNDRESPFTQGMLLVPNVGPSLIFQMVKGIRFLFIFLTEWTRALLHLRCAVYGVENSSEFVECVLPPDGIRSQERGIHLSGVVQKTSNIYL